MAVNPRVQWRRPIGAPRGLRPVQIKRRLYPVRGGSPHPGPRKFEGLCRVSEPYPSNSCWQPCFWIRVMSGISPESSTLEQRILRLTVTMPTYLIPTYLPGSVKG